MTTPELVEFVKNEVEAGVPRDIISNKLKTQGWNEIDIVEVFSIVLRPSMIHNSSPVLTSSVPPVQQPIQQPIDQPLPQTPSIQQPIQTTLPEQSFQTISTLDSSPKQSTKTKKLLKYILIPLVIIILLGGAALAYGFGYLTNSSKLFSQIIDSSKNKTSLSYDVNLNFDASNIKTTTDTSSLEADKLKVITFGMKGSSDFSNKDNLKLKSSMSFKASDIEAGIDFRIINQSIYFSLTKAPDLGFFSLKPLENKWVVSPIKDASSDLTNNPLTSVSPVSTNLFSGFTDEQKQHISDIVKNGKLIKISKNHLPVMIDGSLSYHFDFIIDKEGTISFLKNLTEYVKSLNKDNGELTKLEDTDYNKAFDAVKTFHGEAWIGIFDKLPHKILINADVINPEKPDDGVAKLTMSMIYTDWGKPVVVDVPTGAVTIKELMSGMFGGNISSSISDSTEVKNPIADYDPLVANEKAKDAAIKAILSSMLPSSILYSDKNNNSYKGFCSFKGSNGAYSFAVTLPKNSLYKCNDSNKSWAAWVKISTGDKWCIDSNQYQGVLKNTEKSATCL